MPACIAPSAGSPYRLIADPEAEGGGGRGGGPEEQP